MRNRAFEPYPLTNNRIHRQVKGCRGSHVVSDLSTFFVSTVRGNVSHFMNLYLSPRACFEVSGEGRVIGIAVADWNCNAIYNSNQVVRQSDWLMETACRLRGKRFAQWQFSSWLLHMGAKSK
jgi:hypothetical protein